MAVRNNCVATIQVLINLRISINAQSNVSELIIVIYVRTYTCT